MKKTKKTHIFENIHHTSTSGLLYIITIDNRAIIMKGRSNNDKLKRRGSKAVRDSSEVPAPPSIQKSKAESAELRNSIEKINDMNSSDDASSGSIVYLGIRYGLGLYLIVYFIWKAFDIRMHAIREYGYVIHEFDPWFNFRATEVSY